VIYSNLAFLALASTTPHTQTLQVPGVTLTNRGEMTYQCPGSTPVKVTYATGDNGQSFAMAVIDGKPVLMVDSMAASDVRYVAGSMIWWTKGKHADLYDAVKATRSPSEVTARPSKCYFETDLAPQESPGRPANQRSSPR
jgi:membrane-bound inhibitor of C-type lysozyme